MIKWALCILAYGCNSNNSFKTPGTISRRTVTLKRDNSTATDYYYQNAGDGVEWHSAMPWHSPIRAKASSPVQTQVRDSRPIQSVWDCQDVSVSLTKTPIYQVPPPPPQPVPIIKNPVIRKLQVENLPSLSITSSVEQDSVLGMDRRPEKEGKCSILDLSLIRTVPN